MTQDLFDSNSSEWNAPLAFRMRPQTLEEFVGQEHLLGEGKLLRRSIAADRVSSLVFYGPPGTGKTTLAYLISKATRARFKTVNAVTSNVQELRKILEEAIYRRRQENERTLLFIDEIHRFNKAQQDVLMPEVENGAVILIGATTHNPSFSINGPLLSRSVIFELRPLSEDQIIRILKHALSDPERGFGKLKIEAEEEALVHLAKNAAGDARRALNALEIGVLSTPGGQGTIRFDRKVAEESVQRKIVYYDRDEDYHYDTASAFIKSMRGSDPDAAVYWLAKMLYAGEDPRFIARRMMILAAEDIGNADPQALILATSAMQACEFVGLPEARIILAQAVVYLASAPKSNASYLAIENATGDVESQKVEEVPEHLRDTHYRGAKKMGHGEGYQYAHDFPGHFVDQEYLGKKKKYYFPTDSGFEKNVKERLEALERRRARDQGASA
ncbi:MAG: replication-associated recombination protein A [Candidatus Omnitrophica bacterium]|nr:replication-associated recombination protein A [Candidatus Omnitrophota bacterium]